MDKDAYIQFKDQRMSMKSNHHRIKKLPAQNNIVFYIYIYIFLKICFINLSTKKSYHLKKSKESVK